MSACTVLDSVLETFTDDRGMTEECLRRAQSGWLTNRLCNSANDKLEIPASHPSAYHPVEIREHL